MSQRIENEQVLAALAELKKNMSDLASNHADASLPELLRSEVGLAMQELLRHAQNLCSRMQATDHE